MHWQDAIEISWGGVATRMEEGRHRDRMFLRFMDGSCTVSVIEGQSIVAVFEALPKDIEDFTDWQPGGLVEGPKTLVCARGSHRFKGYKPEPGLVQDFCFRFDSSCEVEQPGHAINKLTGISDAIHHHIDSVRMGWRWREDKGYYEILPYVRQNWAWNREQVVLGTAVSGLWYSGSLGITQGKYWVKYNSNKYETERTGYCNLYVTGAYFGGKEKAKHKMKIDMVWPHKTKWLKPHLQKLLLATVLDGVETTTEFRTR